MSEQDDAAIERISVEADVALIVQYQLDLINADTIAKAQQIGFAQLSFMQQIGEDDERCQRLLRWISAHLLSGT